MALCHHPTNLCEQENQFKWIKKILIIFCLIQFFGNVAQVTIFKRFLAHRTRCLDKIETFETVNSWTTLSFTSCEIIVAANINSLKIAQLGVNFNSSLLICGSANHAEFIVAGTKDFTKNPKARKWFIEMNWRVWNFSVYRSSFAFNSSKHVMFSLPNFPFLRYLRLACRRANFKKLVRCLMTWW